LGEPAALRPSYQVPLTVASEVKVGYRMDEHGIGPARGNVASASLSGSVTSKVALRIPLFHTTATPPVVLSLS
jgi:hypothetical protein